MDALEPREREALFEALDDEYQAWATYDQVIADFGPVRPFTNIRDAEARHIAALAALFAHFGLALPDNPWPGRVPRHANLRQASQQRHLPAFRRCAERGGGVAGAGRGCGREKRR